MKKCPFCNAEIEENTRFCLYCMTVLNEKQVLSNKRSKITRRLFIIAALFVFTLSSIWGIFALLKPPPISAGSFISTNEESELQNSNISTEQTIEDTSHSDSASTSHDSSSSKPENNSSEQNSSSSVPTDNSSENTPTTSQNSSSVQSSQTSAATSDSSSSSQTSSEIVNDYRDILTYKQLTTSPYGISITKCDTNAKGNVVIPKTIDGMQVTVIDTFAFQNCNQITSVTIPSGVQQLRVFSFSYCSSLSSISIPDSVTFIGGNVFEGCSSLKSITFPANLTTIELYAFVDCTSLTTVRIPATVTRIRFQAFFHCNNLKHIYYGGDATTKSLIRIEGGQSTAFHTATWHYNSY